MSFVTDGYFPSTWYPLPDDPPSISYFTTLAKATEWYWRVSEWRFTLNLFVSIFEGFDPILEGNFDLVLDLSGDSAEVDLVQGQQNIQYVGTIMASDEDLWLTFSLSLWYQSPPLYKVGDNYYPNIQFNGFAHITEEATEGYGFDIYEQPGWAGSDCFLTLGPEASITTALQLAPDLGITGALSLNPLAWFPWERDGMPTWDSSNGALLNILNTDPVTYVQFP